MNPADQGLLEREGRAAFPGFVLRALARTTSTQDVVRAAARSGAAPGFCCIADVQTAGRGRQQRDWSAAPGSSLLTSVLVRVTQRRLGGASIAAGLAVRAAIEATSGCRPLLKWPNDVLAGGGKLAGILCEVEAAAPPGPGVAVVIGVGVNLEMASFPAGIAGASLDDLATTVPSPRRLLTAILPALANRLALLDAGGVAALRSEWMEHASGLGSTITAVSGAGQLTGAIEGIDDDGALLLRTATGLVRVIAGDVHIGAMPRADDD